MGITIHSEDDIIRGHLFEGMTGMELESQRIDKKGRISRKEHPFPGDPFIDRDFGEAQIEIGTRPFPSVTESFEELRRLLGILHHRLKEDDELLWPFSNPPVINGEEDIIIARYEGEKEHKTLYRQYLARKYGRYKMTFSGIHFNYSFSDELLHRNFELDWGTNYREYKDRFYLEMAQKVLEYGWAVVALLAASPLVDSSFYEKGSPGRTVFTGTSSLRCSVDGYWNYFSPYIDYTSISRYADSIKQHVDTGMLCQAAELYYPVRIKNPGIYTLDGLKTKGIDHIELRVIDLNPFSDQGMEFSDAVFLKLFLIWLASKEATPLNGAAQVQALHNFKIAAVYDWDIASIVFPDMSIKSLREALSVMLREMEAFFESFDERETDHIRFQMSKVKNKEDRYAYRVLEGFGDDYVKKGLERAEQIQESYNE